MKKRFAFLLDLFLIVIQYPDYFMKRTLEKATHECSRLCSLQINKEINSEKPYSLPFPSHIIFFLF